MTPNPEAPMTQNHAKEAAKQIELRLRYQGCKIATTHDAIADIQAAIDAACAEKDERIATLEATLADAAAKLQEILPIGQVKHIGLRQVPGAIDMLIAEKDAALEPFAKIAPYFESHHDEWAAFHPDYESPCCSPTAGELRAAAAALATKGTP